jgi:transposase
MRNYKQISDKDRSDAVSMYLTEKNMSLEAIGRVFRVSGATVSKWVDERQRIME